jgi:hypothetical protein
MKWLLFLAVAAVLTVSAVAAVTLRPTTVTLTPVPVHTPEMRTCDALLQYWAAYSERLPELVEKAQQGGPFLSAAEQAVERAQTMHAQIVAGGCL